MNSADPARTPNRLAGETSPYLRQHALNPVDWYPWGPEALDEARCSGRPILLSIGYSACHWCHVMAHESFEDPATARVMNEHFVNIKADREERPDLDRIYQTAFQLLQGRGGGWPLTMFLSPEDQVPFFGGTYFPPEPRHGMPAFADLLRRVAEFYRQRGEAVREQNEALVKALAAAPGDAPASELGPAPLSAAREQLLQAFDPVHGGFGSAPKFPHPSNLEFLLRRAAPGVPPDRDAARAVHLTLRRMAEGGLYDHLGGGFCRYSVDERWAIPHFEKMLYDNGPLLGLYAAAWRVSGDEELKRAAEETAAWAIREMQAPEGGFYATLDADSEGEEGRYYVWSRDEVQAALSADAYAVVAARFGLDRPPNFEGRWHLHVERDLVQTARMAGTGKARAAALLAGAREALFRLREQRVRPGRDEKILTSWNGLMVKGLAQAARHLDRPDLADAATRAVDFLRGTMWRGGRLLAAYKDGQARLPGYLDDHALLIDGLMELLQVRWRDADLELAVALAEVLLEHFRDARGGGFYFTADDHEALIHRPKPSFDDALPSGNGVAALVLGRLGHLLGEARYLDAARDTLRWAQPWMERAPMACAALLAALEEALRPPQSVVIRGAAEAIEDWRRLAATPYAPHRVTLAIPGGAQALPGMLAQRRCGPGPLAYLCTGTECAAPVDSFEAFARALGGAAAD